MSDALIRDLERKLDAANDSSVALQLFHVRKRIGDPEAGPKWYLWKMYAERKDDNLRDPNSLVYWIDDHVYCDECGPNLAEEYMDIPQSYGYIADPYDPSYDPDDIQSIVDEQIDSNYGWNLYTMLGESPHWELREPGDEGHPDDEWVCASPLEDCGVILKLDTHDIGWEDALADERPKSKKRRKKKPRP